MEALFPPAADVSEPCPDCKPYNQLALQARFDIAAAGIRVPSALGASPDNPSTVPDSAARHSAASRHVARPAAPEPPASFNSLNASGPAPTSSATAVSPTGSTGAVPKKKTCKTQHVSMPATSRVTTSGASLPVRGPPITVGDIPLSFSVPQLRAMTPGTGSWHASDGDEPGAEESEDMDTDEEEYSDEDESSLPSGQAGVAAGQVTHAEASNPAAAPQARSTPPPPSTPGGRGGAAAPDPDSIAMDELSVLERACLRCGLVLPLGDAQVGPRARIHLLGQDVEPTPPPRMAKLPMVPGFAEALHSTWETRKDPPKLNFLIDCVDAAKAGIPTCPPMDKLMAQSLINNLKPSHVKTGPGGRPPIRLKEGMKDPGFTIDFDDKQSTRVRNSYRSSALVARTLNATQILLSSARRLFSEMREAPTEETAEEGDKNLRMLMELNLHAIEWLGHGMDYCMQAERARWLDKVTLPATQAGATEKILQDLPGHPTSLMGGGLELLIQEVQDKKVALELMAATTDPQQPEKREKKQGRAKAQGQADRGRSSSKRGGHNPPRTPSSSAGPPRSASGTPSHSQGRNPPRQGGQTVAHKARGKQPRK